MEKRAWLFCRIGGGHEHDGKEILAQQERQLLDYCAEQGLRVAGMSMTEKKYWHSRNDSYWTTAQNRACGWLALQQPWVQAGRNWRSWWTRESPMIPLMSLFLLQYPDWAAILWTYCLPPTSWKKTESGCVW